MRNMRFTTPFGLLICLIILPLSAQAIESVPWPTPWKDHSCEMSKADLKLEPRALLSEFLKRDAGGEFRRASPWMGKAVGCPGHLPGPDFSTVILDYQVVSTKVEKTGVTFMVRYRCAGTLGSGGKQGELHSFSPKAQTQDITFTAIKTPHGWKLDRFAWMMILPKPSLKTLSRKNWVTGDRERFMEATQPN